MLLFNVCAYGFKQELSKLVVPLLYNLYMTKYPLLAFVLVFAIMMALTQYLTYQQFSVVKEKQRQELINEAASAKDKFRNILSDDIAAANTLAIVYKQNQIHNDFDSIARQIILVSRYAEVLQLTVNGIITNAYPDARYKTTVGTNISTDAVRKAEANRAAERKNIYFAGPRKLRFGDTGIVGKVPVIVNNRLTATVAVLTRLRAIRRALNVAAANRFIYQLLKINGRDTSIFALSNESPAPHAESAAIPIPDGDWLLRVSFRNKYNKDGWPYQLSIFGFLFSFVTGLLGYRKLREPAVLKKIIKEQTERLAASERYFRTLVENSLNAIRVMDKDGNPIFQTRSSERIFGFSLEERQKMSPEDLVHLDDRETYKQAYCEMLDNPGKAVQRKLRIKHKNGNFIWIDCSFQNLLHDENVRAIVISSIDITEKELYEENLARAIGQLKQLNNRLEKKAKELASSNAELEQFAYVASHDLQEPLRMITSFLAKLETKYESLLDTKGKQYIHFATDGAKRMRELILDLLEFSRVGRTKVKIENVDLNQLVNDVLGLYQVKITELEAKVNVAVLPTFETYKNPLMQVFQNLIDNSLKYHEKGVKPVIDINYTENNLEYEFSVKDNGIGMSSEFYSKIFVVFQRLHNKDEYSGTGMGLAITKKIVENMGGRIWVESAEGAGSTFYFTVLKNS